MKTLICCLNSKYVHASLAPFYLLSGVRAYCDGSISAKVFEGTINGDMDDLLEKISAEKPQIISFSCYIWNIEKTLELAKKIKATLGATIILGGPEVAYRSEEILESYSFIDFVISGEGEESFPALLNALANGQDFSKIGGLSYRDNGIRKNPEQPLKIPYLSPYSEDYFENLRGRISYIETSRGCPYRCAFCLSGRCGPVRFFPLEQVKKDIIALANSGTKTVKFVDRTFNANPSRADEILQFIIDNYKKEIPKGVCFHFEIAGDILKDSTLKILESAEKGLFQLEIGMQSFNEETLKAINRKTDTKKLIENIKKLVSFGNMHIHIDLIAGLKGEDIKSFENSFNIGFGLRANMLQLGFLKLLYGAEMRENRDEFPCEFGSAPPYEVTSTPWLTEKEIESLKKCEDALERLYNSGRFLETVDYLLSVGYTPFKLFSEIGEKINGQGLNLWDYTEKIYLYFKDKENIDDMILREKMVCDLLLSVSNPKIPEGLKVQDKIFKRVKKTLAEKLGADVKTAILYSENKVLAVSKNSETNLFGRKRPTYFQLEEFIE